MKIKCSVRFRWGDEVWVKPGNAKCITKWDKGTVTHINSSNNIDVDGMARQLLDVRRKPRSKEKMGERLR